MKLFSNKKIILASALMVLTSTASAERFNVEKVERVTSGPEVSYTAHGKTDRKTAQLFKQLMQNGKNIKIEAEVVAPAKSTAAPAAQGNTEVSVNYTIRGKTTMDTVRRLKKLFETHEYVEITASARVKMSKDKFQQLIAASRQPAAQNQQVNTAALMAYPYPYTAYQPVYYRGYNAYGYNTPAYNMAYPGSYAPVYYVYPSYSMYPVINTDSAEI